MTTTSPATGGAEGRRLALVVAVTDYIDVSLRRLRAPADDAADLRDLLADPEVGGFSVTSVVNERAHQIRMAVEDFLADRRTGDLVLVYLSCHGLMDARRRLYFAARDTVKNRLASSGVESHWLLDQLEECRARRQVVILDCCFSGAFARGSKGDDDLGLGDRLIGEGRGRVVLTSSRGTEYSFEGDPLQGEDGARGSVFTSAFIEGIRTGRADTDNDGDISVEDAYAYAFEQVRQAGTPQTPQRWLYGAEGTILLARTPSPTTTSPVPEPVAAAPPALPPLRPEAAAAEQQSPKAGSRPRKRKVVLGVLGGLVLATAALVGVQLAGDPTGRGSLGPDEFAQDSPWRLRIDPGLSNGDGCDVTLTNLDSDDIRKWTYVYGPATFQMRESGTFRYDVSDPGCEVLPQRGDGGTENLSFVWSVAEGDSPVFESPGAVSVRVTDLQGSPSCVLDLMSDDDGRKLDTREASDTGSPVRLESDGPRRVFIAATSCTFEVSSTD